MAEAQNFLNICENSDKISTSEGNWYLVDGISIEPRSKTEWYYTNSGKKIPNNMPWTNDQPDCNGNVEFCMSLGNMYGKFGFNDLSCTDPQDMPFICQNSSPY